MKYKNLQDVALALELFTESRTPIDRFSFDSRTVAKNNVYIALEGKKVDGHSFLEEAAKRGAAAAIVSKSYSGQDFGIPLLKVDNTVKALQNLAKEAIKLTPHRKIAALTGSVGKTTTKEYLAAILKKKFKVAFSPSNSNSQVGLPLAILNETNGCEDILVLEMGMTFPGEIANLVDIAPPEAVLITNVALQHAINFDNIEGIARAKGEILQSPYTKAAFLPAGMASIEEILKIGNADKRIYSTTDPLAEHHLVQTEDGSYQGRFFGSKIELKDNPLKKRHLIHNFFAAACLAGHFGMKWEEIVEAAEDLATLKMPGCRQEEVIRGGIHFFNDSYNASELALKAALDSLPEAKAGGKRVAVLGEILELGKYSKEIHERLARYALDKLDAIFCLGEGMLPLVDIWKKEGRSVIWFETRDELVKELKKSVSPGDVVLLKGSKRFMLWEVLNDFPSC